MILDYKKANRIDFVTRPSDLQQGEAVVVASDPDHEEEAVMDGKLVLGINPYREICTLHLAGTGY